MEPLYFGLSVAMQALPFAMAVLLPVVLVFGVISFYNNPVIGAGAAIWIFVLETAIIVQPSLPLGVRLFIPDILFALMAVAGLLRLFGLRMQGPHYLWLLFGAVLLVSFLLGVLRYGTAAGVEFRTFFYFWTGVWYLSTFQLTGTQLQKILGVYISAAAAMLVLALMRWTAMAWGLDIAAYWNEGGSSIRVLDAGQTFFLGQAFVVGLYAHLTKTGPKWWGPGLPLLFVCVVLLQHRTVWAVVLVSVALIFLWAGKTRSRAASTLAVAAVLGMAVLLPFIAGGQLDTVQRSMEHSVNEVGQEKSTLAWRVQSWQALIEQWASAGPVVNMIGKPFGSGFARRIAISQIELTQNPHSHYVYALLRVGLLGFAAMLAVYYVAMRSAWKSRDPVNEHHGIAALLMVLVIGQLVYFISYPAHYSQLLPLGLSLALLGQRQRQSKAVRAINKGAGYAAFRQ